MSNEARRARIISVLVLLMTFLVGGLAGAATMRVVASDGPPRHERGPRGPERMFERLQLTPEQQVQARAILEQGRVEMEAFWKAHGPTMRAITDTTRARLRAIMTPEQRALDAEFMTKRRQEFQRRGDRR